MARTLTPAEVAMRTDSRNLLQQMVNDAYDAVCGGSSTVQREAAHVLARAASRRDDVHNATRRLGAELIPFGSPAAAAGDAGLRGTGPAVLNSLAPAAMTTQSNSSTLRRYLHAPWGTADARRVGRELRRSGAERRIVSQWARTGWDSLTNAELKVVNLIAQGATNRAAADQLHLSLHTVKTHVTPHLPNSASTHAPSSRG